jgi:hypothetical protein
VFVITVAISSNDEIKVLVVKISCSIAFASKIVSFVIIKLNSNKVFQLYDRIKEYQTKVFVKYFWGNDVWPGNSLDMNAAENFCSIIKDEVEKKILA